MKGVLDDLRSELLEPTTWLALAALLVMFAIGQCLDAPTERNPEMTLSADLLQAQRDAQAAMRREAAGAAFCLALVGESIPLWDEDGRLSACQPRKGKKVAL